MKPLILTILSLLLIQVCQAQLTNELNKHVIIAFDAYPGGYSYTLNNEPSKVAGRINKLIKTLDLDDNDYITVIEYGIGTRDESLENYVSPAVVSGKKIVWCPYSSLRNIWGDNYSNWTNIVNSHRNSGERFSMLTGAKFYSLKSLFGKNGDKQANKTYLLMITDNQYNGQGDMDAEFVHFMQLDNGFNKKLTREDFRNTCIDVSNNYNFVYLDEEPIVKTNETQIYSAILFEVRPASYPSIHSIVQYPADLGIKRVRGGYELDFDYKLIDPDKYEISKLGIDIFEKDDNIESYAFYGDENRVKIKINSSSIKGDSLKVSIKGWLKKKDEIYNSAIMNPNDEAYRHLLITETLSLEDKYKILGFIPLPDFLWFCYPSNLRNAIFWWDMIAIFLLVGLAWLVGYKFYYKVTRYKPANEDIKITHF